MWLACSAPAYAAMIFEAGVGNLPEPIQLSTQVQGFGKCTIETPEWTKLVNRVIKRMSSLNGSKRK